MLEQLQGFPKLMKLGEGGVGWDWEFGEHFLEIALLSICKLLLATSYKTVFISYKGAENYLYKES